MKKSYLLLSLLTISLFACREAKEEESGLAAVIGNDTQIVNGNYTIRAVHSNKCLDVPGSSRANSIQIQQFDCNGTNAQLWRITKVDGRFVTIVNVNSGKALDIAGASQADGAQLHQFDIRNGQQHQQFSIEGGGGQLAIRARHSGKVLDVVNRSTANAAKVQQFNDFRATNQRWVLDLKNGNAGNAVAAPAPVVAPAPAPAPAPAAAPAITPGGRANAVGAAAAQCVGGPQFDPAGVKNVGNGRGIQFVGGQCLSNADCGTGCCALPCGICSGPGAQFQAGKQGCGFGR